MATSVAADVQPSGRQHGSWLDAFDSMCLWFLMELLIDRDGKVYEAGSAELRHHFCAPVSSASLPDFLVKSDGWIEIRIDRDTLLLRAVPARVEFATYASALLIVQQHTFRRAALSWFDGCWNSEVFRAGGDAIRRLMDLMLDGDLVERKHFHSLGRNLESLERNDPLAAVAAMWCDHGGQLALEAARSVLNDKLDAKYSIVARDRSNGTLRFQEFGPGLLIYSGRGNMSVCLGKPVQDQPDYQYGRWIAEGYREAMFAKEPRVMDMDVVVGDPLNGQRRRLQYRRLTLPVKMDDGNAALLSAVCVDPRINLSFKIHNEVE